MAKKYSEDNGFDYDVIVRCRPDNSMFPNKLNLSALEYPDNLIYSTVFRPSGHRDLCFFAMSNPETFQKYVFIVFKHEIQKRKCSKFSKVSGIIQISKIQDFADFPFSVFL